MNLDFTGDILKAIAENIVLFGGALMALFYGIKRMYGLARNVEKLVETGELTREAQKQNAILAEETRKEIKKDLEWHIEKEDEKFIKISAAVDSIAEGLRVHIKAEEERNLIRDNQLIKLADNMEEVISEMRPNGGSSMKDIMNATKDQVTDIHTRVSVLETKEGMEHKPLPHRSAKKKIVRKKKKMTAKRK